MQIAAALTMPLAERRGSAHSAGAAAQTGLDPKVRPVIAEFGVNPDEAFADGVVPAADAFAGEVVRAADVLFEAVSVACGAGVSF